MPTSAPSLQAFSSIDWTAPSFYLGRCFNPIRPRFMVASLCRTRSQAAAEVATGPIQPCFAIRPTPTTRTVTRAYPLAPSPIRAKLQFLRYSSRHTRIISTLSRKTDDTCSQEHSGSTRPQFATRSRSCWPSPSSARIADVSGPGLTHVTSDLGRCPAWQLPVKKLRERPALNEEPVSGREKFTISGVESFSHGLPYASTRNR